MQSFQLNNQGMVSIIKRKLLFLFPALFLLTSCSSQKLNLPCHQSIIIKGTIPQEKLMKDLRILSSNFMQGRQTGTLGSLRAQEYIIQQFQELELRAFYQNYTQAFTFSKNHSAKNIVGWLKGKTFPDRYIVITAHYDHLGMLGNKVYNGADDNASGVSTMLNLAHYFQKNRPEHSIIFAAMDAEEAGLFGAKFFVKNSPVAIQKILLNINLDMLAQDEAKKRLYISGLHKNPHLKIAIKNALKSPQLCIKQGHEGRYRNRKSIANNVDWSNASDHAEFRKANIPYLYFGVDPHRHYHQLTDTYESINPTFFTAVSESILSIVKQLDKQLEQ